MDLTYFNPGLQDETSFRANFVARQATLGFLLRQLRLTAPGQPARHHLIVAPRGYGKTSLLRRIALAVRDEPELAQNFVALRFREEQHNVISLDVFWRNCLESLLEAREDEHAPEAEIAALEAAWSSHTPRQALSREDQDGHPAWSALQSHCEQLGRRPLLLVDNLDTLLAGLSNQHQWALRKHLQSEDGPMLLAAASRYPESTHDPAAAFYEFFRIQTLDRLDNQEVLQCLRTIAQHRGTPGLPVLALLDKEPGRIAALNTMAGGNPRTLNVLYSVLESHLSADVLSQLSAMLDTFTGWYQARTEELPMQARAVFDALALNWNPMTAAALGQATGLDTPSVSSQLSRLEKSGYVETVALSSKGKGRSGYQVSERFFNIWYLMRNGSRRAQHKVRFLTAFLQSCFSSAERRHLARSALLNPKIDPDYAVALANLGGGRLLRQQLFAHARDLASQLGRDDEYRDLVQEMQAGVRHRRGTKHSKANEVSPATGVMEPKPNTAPQGLAEVLSDKIRTGSALANEGRRLFDLGAFDQAIQVYDELLSSLGTSTEPALCERIARTLFSKGITLGRLGRKVEETQCYDRIVSLFGNATEPALRLQVARALLNKSFELQQSGYSEQALDACEDLFSRFDMAPELPLRERVAQALFNKGVMLGHLGHPEREIEAYDSIHTRFGSAPEFTLRQLVARALYNKGVTQGELGHHEESIETYDRVIHNFGDAAELTFREEVAKALVSKGIALRKLDRPVQEIESYDCVLSRFGDDDAAALTEQVAYALVNKAFRLGQLGRPGQALEVYEQILSRFGDATEPALHAQLAWTLLSKGIILDQLGRPEQALETYDQLLSYFSDATEPTLREQVARALVNKGALLGQLGHRQSEIEVYEDVLSRFGGAAGPALRETVAVALVGKGLALGHVGRPQQAIEAFDTLLALLTDTNEPSLRKHIWGALESKANMLSDLGEINAARDTYRAANELNPTAVGPILALGNLALDHSGDPAEAASQFESGLSVATDSSDISLLHANFAYAVALHGGSTAKTRWHAERAMSDGKSMSAAGRNMLEALSAWAESSGTDWHRLFEGIDKAVDSGDSELWASYLDDIQRLIWAALSQGQGPALQRWMEEADYPLRQAPLYHAVRAAIDGEDHLLQINPETREPAGRIYEGIARRLRIYAPKPVTKQSKRRRST